MISRADIAYSEALQVIINKGERVPTRAKLLSTGKNVGARSVVGYQFRFDVSYEFPLITTKFVSYNNILRELLWFVSGSTNERDLSRHGVHIWKEWAGEDGELGPIYGAAWRRYEGKNKTVDQLAAVVEGVRATIKDPTASVARRLIVNAWDPTRLDEMALPPCHVLFQLFVREGGTFLDMSVYQRSGDLFLGVPYNLASYATLLHMIARVTNLVPRDLHYTFGDLHLYDNHSDQAEEQMSRAPGVSPELLITPKDYPSEIDDFKFEHFELLNYHPQPALRGEVAV